MQYKHAFLNPKTQKWLKWLLHLLGLIRYSWPIPLTDTGLLELTGPKHAFFFRKKKAHCETFYFSRKKRDRGIFRPSAALPSDAVLSVAHARHLTTNRGRRPPLRVAASNPVSRSADSCSPLRAPLPALLHRWRRRGGAPGDGSILKKSW